MQIVIDLPEEVYKKAKDGNLMSIHSMMICGAVAEGTPLPKGHGRLIDVSDLTPDSEWDYYDDEFIAVSMGQIISAPTIIEADKAESEDTNDN